MTQCEKCKKRESCETFQNEKIIYDNGMPMELFGCTKFEDESPDAWEVLEAFKR